MFAVWSSTICTRVQRIVLPHTPSVGARLCYPSFCVCVADKDMVSHDVAPRHGDVMRYNDTKPGLQLQ